MLITNAKIVTPDEVFIGTLQCDGGRISDISTGSSTAPDAMDWGGDYLLPGFVELHTDNLEKHLMPRPGVLWNAQAALVMHDVDVAAAGITTVFDALAVGSRDQGVRGREVQGACAKVLEQLAGHLRADHYLHLRCEVAAADVVDAFDALASHPRLQLASVMDHTPGQRQWRNHAQWRRYHERHGKIADAQIETVLVEMREEQERFSTPHRQAIVERCATLGIAVASHDDTDIDHVEQAVIEGIALSEFPTTLAAARAAHERGISTIMGGPNVVRGGSHSGNVSALELAEAGCLDILSSDYVPASLLLGAFTLAGIEGWDLPRAVRTISLSPAQRVGLTDRGAVAPGLRADFVRVTMINGQPVPVETHVCGRRVA
ncbi:alpha-D-ribose 1-methylphosphonate 5-triphosphate diphosphatase [Sphingobium sp. OAS761]|uniref:alpha-D-ribose 1-methylphosphonate 5-triphosphate diphosphatase n=1 Tax=Sphingobium sp. OAS761 TaxID=2817901 RepID=UPI0020A13FC2|nr:alpha-D-ribose 1-methylphosphonate 5-triphosphate diphosphatase [Sphingobium sp. OAS761]MCP1470450.1 alpha-D-ribose 1-methylphosphonate 5-triphosphate diphosphatase [Sphingobium sp. OAS761]